MQFFIPGADSPELAESVYACTKEFLKKELGAELSHIRICSLSWGQDGKNYTAEVGKPTTFNGELVIAILYDDGRKLYHVCTPNRGVGRGGSILAGSSSVTDLQEFEGPWPASSNEKPKRRRKAANPKCPDQTSETKIRSKSRAKNRPK